MDKQSKIELILALALSAPLLESRPWFWAAKPAAKRTRRRTRGAKGRRARGDRGERSDSRA